MFKLFKRKEKKPDPSPLKELTIDEFEEAKFKSRIAFIDDEEIAHVSRLQEDGYSITHYSDIENIDDFLRKKYHVVILDIQGVGQQIAPNTEGWGILKYLKQSNPNIVVIMYTGADWSITKYKDEAAQADDFIGKDLEFLDFKAKLDEGIKKAFSPSYHFEIERKKLLKTISNSNTISEIKTIIDEYGKDKESTISLVKKVTDNKAVIDSVSSLLSITDGIFKLLG